MAKFNFRLLTTAEQEAMQEELLEMLTALKRKSDLQSFLPDLLTPSEIVMIVRRIRTAKLLLQGRTYEEIRQALGVGYTTIRVVDTWLARKFTSYRQIITPLIEREARKKKRSVPGEEGPWKTLRRKYPLHSLLLNVLLDDMEWNTPRRQTSS